MPVSVGHEDIITSGTSPVPSEDAQLLKWLSSIQGGRACRSGASLSLFLPTEWVVTSIMYVYVSG